MSWPSCAMRDELFYLGDRAADSQLIIAHETHELARKNQREEIYTKVAKGAKGRPGSRKPNIESRIRNKEMLTEFISDH